MIELSFDQANELLDRAIAERGEDYVYVNQPGLYCLYFHDEQPGCLIGHLPSYLGFTDSDIKKRHAENAKAKIILNVLKIKVDSATRTLLQRVQDNQDQRCTWGDSVKEARDYVDRLLNPGEVH